MGVPPLSLTELLRDARGLSDADFLHRHATPYLLVEPLIEDNDDDWSFDTVHIELPASRAGQGDPKTKNPEPGLSTVVFAVRKEGLSEANLVTIGRTKTSDIWLDNKAVSKLHAYFSRDPISKGYTIADAGSTNGTVIAGRRLAQREPVSLEGGEEIEIAGRFKATYLLPEKLLAFLRERLSGF